MLPWQYGLKSQSETSRLSMKGATKAGQKGVSNGDGDFYPVCGDELPFDEASEGQGEGQGKAKVQGMGYGSSTLAPPQGKASKTNEVPPNEVSVTLRWMSGERIPGRHGVTELLRFITELEEGMIDGVPTAFVDGGGHYDLLLGTRNIVADDLFFNSGLVLKDIDGIEEGTELTLVFVRGDRWWEHF